MVQIFCTFNINLHEEEKTKGDYCDSLLAIINRVYRIILNFMTAIQHSTNFFNWFTKIGGNIQNFDFQKTAEQTKYRPLFFSSLKINPERTKQLYNYKFKNHE